ncbi:hypothetical protein [Streptomyces sp. T12]|uniref:hypothetical protein n=1 Tax=Streptomyces sp. T12 TaxID=477697 RepID=UPI001646450B
MSKMDECGQEPVDERQPVFRACAHGPFPRPGGEPGLVTLVPQRTYCSDEFSNHLSWTRPVIRRSLMIAARDAFPTTSP